MSSKREGRDNCPNCGAPIDGETCPYCGTRFIDFASMDTDKPFWMKIKRQGKVFVVRVLLREVELVNPEPIYIDAFGEVPSSYILSCYRELPEIKLSMTVLPTEKGE